MTAARHGQHERVGAEPKHNPVTELCVEHGIMG